MAPMYKGFEPNPEPTCPKYPKARHPTASLTAENPKLMPGHAHIEARQTAPLHCLFLGERSTLLFLLPTALMWNCRILRSEIQNQGKESNRESIGNPRNEGIRIWGNTKLRRSWSSILTLCLVSHATSMPKATPTCKPPKTLEAHALEPTAPYLLAERRHTRRWAQHAALQMLSLQSFQSGSPDPVSTRLTFKSEYSNNGVCVKVLNL